MSLLINMPTTPANLARNVAENKAIYRRKFVDGFGFRANMNTISTGVRDLVPMARIRTGDILRPGRTGVFAPTPNAVTFSARTAVMRPVKGDVEFTELQINQLWNTYIGHLEMLEGEAAQNDYILRMPFEGIVVDELLKQAHESYRMRCAFLGTYNAAGTTSASCDDGLVTKMTAAFGADIPAANLVATAAPTPTNMVSITQALVDLITAQAPAYINQPLNMYMSPRNAQYYRRNVLALYGAGHAQWQQQYAQPVLFEQPNISIIEEVGMTGSNRIFVTEKENLNFLTDSSNGANIRFLEKIRSWDVAIDWISTLDFAQGDLIWSNTLA